jgi:replicative DNA helicase
MNARTASFAPGLDIDDRQIATLRLPPHSIEAESSVLGGLLLDNAAWDRVGDLLVDNDFYRYEHRLIYASIGALSNASKQVDIVTVFVELEKAGKGEECGGLAYLNSLAQYVPSASNIRRYAEIVRERSILRKLVSASDEIATAAFNPDGKSVDAVLDEAERKIYRIREDGAGNADEWEGVDVGVVQCLDRIQASHDGVAAPDYITTGLKDLDERLDGGLRGGELIVIGARSGMGKSALAQTIAEHVALVEKKPVPIFSLEMAKQGWINRFLASLGKIHLGRIRRPERLREYDWPALTEATELLRQAPIEINDQAGLNINQIRAKARSFARRRGKPGLIVVDHLGLTTGTDRKANRNYQVAEVSGGLKQLAKELGCPIVLLVQIKRGVDERSDPMPQLADLRDSGDIENDADVVLFVHRPIKNKPDLGEVWEHYAKCSVAKLRDGEPGYLHLWYTGENVHFSNWPVGVEIPTTSMSSAASTRKPL